MRRLTPLLIAGLLLTGCASVGPATRVTETPTSDPRTEVPWEDYADTVKPRIDDLTDSADCTALQTEFDNAEANSDQVAQNTDHNNAQLMAYIDEALELAGCY